MVRITPIYKPWSSAIWKGSHNPTLRGQQRSPWLLTTYIHWDDPPSWTLWKGTQNQEPSLYHVPWEIVVGLTFPIKHDPPIIGMFRCSTFRPVSGTGRCRWGSADCGRWSDLAWFFWGGWKDHLCSILNFMAYFTIVALLTIGFPYSGRLYETFISGGKRYVRGGCWLIS